MTPIPIRLLLLAALGLGVQPLRSATEVQARIASEYPSLEALYKVLHLHPELSLQEVNTSARIAAELRSAGFDVRERLALV